MGHEYSLNIEAANLDALMSEIKVMCEAASGRADKAFQEAFKHQHTREGLAAAGKAAAAAAGPSDREEINLRLSDVIDFYLSAEASERIHLRGLVATNRSLRWHVFGHSSWCAERMKTSQDWIWFRRAVASLSLEDNSDYRDTLKTLREIYRRAQDLGIDVSKELRFVASISTETPPGLKAWGIEKGMREFLERIAESGFQERPPKQGFVRSLFLNWIGREN